MKLSQFKNTGIIKKIKFINGELIKEENNTAINGEIEFYDLNIDRVRKINDEVIQKLKGDEDDIEMSYKMLPYLCNIEIDLTLDEFKQMNNETPTKQFALFMEEYFNILNELFETAQTIGRIQESHNELAEKLNMEVKQIEQKETPEQEYIRLQTELITVTDKERKKQILNRLSELVSELDG